MFEKLKAKAKPITFFIFVEIADVVMTVILSKYLAIPLPVFGG